jgi:prepilin-type processing-associated H-X9-DG protein
MGGDNVGFADGHAKWLSAEAIMFGGEPGDYIKDGDLLEGGRSCGFGPPPGLVSGPWSPAGRRRRRPGGGGLTAGQSYSAEPSSIALVADSEVTTRIGHGGRSSLGARRRGVQQAWSLCSEDGAWRKVRLSCPRRALRGKTVRDGNLT